MHSVLSAFHPTVARWFEETLGTPSRPQTEGWPRIRTGAHTLIAAPTGTGKTLPGFLWAIDGLLRQGDALPDATQVLYVSPLKALSNDVQRNLERPLRSSVPATRACRRSARWSATGDTPSSQRQAMGRRLRPPGAVR